MPAGRREAGGVHACREPQGAGRGSRWASCPHKGDERLASPLLVKPAEHLCRQPAGIVVVCCPHLAGTCFVVLGEGCSALGAAPALLAPSGASGAELTPPRGGQCHPGEPQLMGIAGRAGLHPCDVRGPIQESFPHPPAESQILHLYLGSFKAASLLWAVPGKMGNALRLFSPFILGKQRSSSKCGFVVVSLSCLSYP